jgi:hypothetical protein
VKLIYNIRKKIALALLIVISAVVLNNSLFVHVHRLDTGEIIVHAHPFNPFSKAADSTAKHNHNAIDLQLIQVLNSASIWIIAVTLVLIICLLRTKITFKRISNYFLSFYKNIPCIRPPPYFAIIKLR